MLVTWADDYVLSSMNDKGLTITIIKCRKSKMPLIAKTPDFDFDARDFIIMPQRIEEAGLVNCKKRQVL